MENVKLALRNNKKLIIALLTPALVSTLPILVGGKPAACTFVLIVMSVYWLSDCIPMAITSLLPVLLYPIFGIMDSRTTSKIYFEVSNTISCSVPIHLNLTINSTTI